GRDAGRQHRRPGAVPAAGLARPGDRGRCGRAGTDGPGRLRSAQGRGPVAEHDRRQRREPAARMAVHPPQSAGADQRDAVPRQRAGPGVRAGPCVGTASRLRLTKGAQSVAPVPKSRFSGAGQARGCRPDRGVDAMNSPTHAPALLALAVAGVLATVGVAPQAVAAATSPAMSAQTDECQRSRRESRGQRSQQEERYPDATRESPTEGASARMGRRLNQINDAMGEDDYDTVLEIANEIQSESRANDYDKAFAANMAGHASFNKDDTEAAKRYIAQAIEYDALDNTNHFQAILMLAQLHAQDEE